MNTISKNPLTMITEVASAAFRASSNNQLFGIGSGLDLMMYSDPVLAKASAAAYRFSRELPQLQDLTKTILDDEEFRLISPREGELDPMILHPGGGIRAPGSEIIYSLFSTAFRHMFFWGLPDEESVYIRTVLEGFEELRKALRGEPVRSYEINGLANIRVPTNSQLNTPWGTIKPAPSVDPHFFFPRIGQPSTQALLIEPKLVPLVFDRSPSPDVQFQPPSEHDLRSSYLLPLSCALASRDPMNPVVPVITWSTFVVPFQGSFGYSMPMLGPISRHENDASLLLEDFEDWARLIHRTHSPEVDVAAKRLVSAVAHRMDKADALIDAVMVWGESTGNLK